MISADEIRILDLQPSTNDDDPIRCDIRKVSLGDHPQYEAVSYVWGDPVDSLLIEVSGEKRLATQNLYAALRQLRLKDKPRALWVDQFCINQENLDEKSKQIRMMRQIYSKTFCCIVWMGVIPEETQLISGNEIPVPYCLSSQEAFEGPYKALLKFTPHGNPWWHRLWTVQEIVIPLNAVLVWGNLSISWERLWQAIMSLAAKKLRPFNLDIWANPHVLNDFCSTVAWLTQMKDTRTYTPLAMFRKLRERKATDARDKVYGLLGLYLSGILKRSERCDYDISVASVYSILTIDIIMSERRLISLTCDPWLPDGIATKNMPRWALDLKTSLDNADFVHLVAYEVYSANARKELNLEKVLATSKISTEILDLEGNLLDEIELVGDQMGKVIEQSVPLNDAILSMSESKMEKLQEHDRKNLALMRSWKALAQGHRSSKERVFRKMTDAGTRFVNQDEAFARLLLGDVVYNVQNDQPLPYRRASAGDAKQVLDFLKSGTPDFSSNVDHTLRITIRKQRFSVTKTGLMGLGHIDTRPKDEVWIFHGGRVPFVVRPKNSNIDDYDFVSRCGVQGIMDGEFFEDRDEKTQDTRRVRLH